MTKSGLFIALLGNVVFVGCAGKPDSDRTCVRNMQMLWDACRSYHLAENVPDDQPVDRKKLNAYFAPRNHDMKCPLGTHPYAPFSYKDGPRCPNAESHTEALRKLERQK